MRLQRCIISKLEKLQKHCDAFLSAAGGGLPLNGNCERADAIAAIVSFYDASTALSSGIAILQISIAPHGRQVHPSSA